MKTQPYTALQATQRHAAAKAKLNRICPKMAAKARHRSLP